MFRRIPGAVFWVAIALGMSVSAEVPVYVLEADTSTQSNWRTAAALEEDSEYGSDGYVIYGLLSDDGVWDGAYDAATLFETDPNRAGAALDSAISLPVYIEDISLFNADKQTGRWSGDGNFGQIEDPNDPNNTLTNTPVIAWGSDPYTFTISRSMAAAFRLTVICANGDGQVPQWTITVDDGFEAKTGVVKALSSPNVVYQTFLIPSADTPITVAVEADAVDGWIAGFAFDTSVSAVGSDTTTQSNWRSAAALEADMEYGTEGYVIYGLNAEEGAYKGEYDAATLNSSKDPGASVDSAISLPDYVADISLADNSGGMWSGNGNFGQIEDPNDPNLILTSTPVLANGPSPYVFTITRSTIAAFRLTVISSCGDGQVPQWTVTVDDGLSAQTRTATALASPNTVYQVFEVPVGSSPVTVSVEADVVNGWITGLAFDQEVGQLPEEEAISGKATLPIPEDGSIIDGAWGWVLLEWEPGPFAASHDVFIGDDFNDVNGATVDNEAVFAGNTPNNFLVAGTPNGAVPEGLAPGTTYYWRVDEVNDADPLGPWKGDVWRFSTTGIGSDITTQSNWRTAAALEEDDEYGSDGYVIYGLNEDDGIYQGGYDASTLIDSNDPGASVDSAISLPDYIADISLADNNGGMWSGNGNFGQIEVPDDPNHTLTSTSVIANGPDPYIFTIARSADKAFTLTVICACGDGQVPNWTITVEDGAATQTATVPAVDSPNIVYQRFEIAGGSGPLTVSTEADVVNGWITGFAFDSE